jgi:DNA-binding NtrC family response regulator
MAQHTLRPTCHTAAQMVLQDAQFFAALDGRGPVGDSKLAVDGTLVGLDGIDRHRCATTFRRYRCRQAAPECRSFTRRKLTQMEALERDAIVRSLEDNGNNKLQAAMALGMSRATIYRKMRDYGIT